MTLEIRSINQFIYCYPPSWVPCLVPTPCLPPLPHGKDKTLQRREFRWVALLRQSPVLQYLKGVAISTHEGILLRDVTSFTPFISFHYIRNYAMTNHMLNFAQGTRGMFKAKSRFNPLRFNKCPCFRCVFGIIIPGRDGK